MGDALSPTRAHPRPAPPLSWSAAGLPERLEVSLAASGQSLVLAGFALGPMELDSALALLEHLAESQEEAASA